MLGLAASRSEAFKSSSRSVAARDERPCGQPTTRNRTGVVYCTTMDTEQVYEATFRQALAETTPNRTSGLAGARERMRRRNRAARVAAQRTRATVGGVAWADMRNRAASTARRAASRHANART